MLRTSWVALKLRLCSSLLARKRLRLGAVAILLALEIQARQSNEERLSCCPCEASHGGFHGERIVLAVEGCCSRHVYRSYERRWATVRSADPHTLIAAKTAMRQRLGVHPPSFHRPAHRKSSSAIYPQILTPHPCHQALTHTRPWELQQSSPQCECGALQCPTLTPPGFGNLRAGPVRRRHLDRP